MPAEAVEHSPTSRSNVLLGPNRCPEAKTAIGAHFPRCLTAVLDGFGLHDLDRAVLIVGGYIEAIAPEMTNGDLWFALVLR